MRSTSSSFFLTCSVLSLLSTLGSALTLSAVSGSVTNGTASNPLAPKNNETFLWGGANDGLSTLATFTYYTSSDQERIINLENIANQITSIQCSNSSVSLVVGDASDFEQVYNLWGWTNQHSNNTLILVAGSGQCGWNTERQPYSISKITYTNSTNTAVLAGTAVQWSTIAANYDLHIGTRSQPQSGNLTQRDLAQRDYNSDYTLDFNHEIVFGNWTIPIDPTYSIGLTCKTCYTQGNFDFDFDIVTRFFIPVDATLNLSPQDVAVVLDPTISLNGNIGPSKTFKETFLRIPIGGITIADIINLGPEIAFSGILSIGPLKGTGSVTAGVNVSLSNSAEVHIDALSPSKFSATGWEPQVTELAPSVSAQLSAGVSLGLLADVEFDITVLGYGLSAGVGLQPLVGATLSAIDSSTGACSNDPEHHQYGIQLAPSAGIYLQASVSSVVTVTITSETIKLSTECFGFGSPITSSSTTTTTSSPSAVTKTSSTVTSTATTKSSSVASSTKASSSTAKASSSAKISSAPVVSSSAAASSSSAVFSSSVSSKVGAESASSSAVAVSKSSSAVSKSSSSAAVSFSSSVVSKVGAVSASSSAVFKSSSAVASSSAARKSSSAVAISAASVGKNITVTAIPPPGTGSVETFSTTVSGIGAYSSASSASSASTRSVGIPSLSIGAITVAPSCSAAVASYTAALSAYSVELAVYAEALALSSAELASSAASLKGSPLPSSSHRVKSSSAAKATPTKVARKFLKLD